MRNASIALLLLFLLVMLGACHSPTEPARRCVDSSIIPTTLIVPPGRIVPIPRLLGRCNRYESH
jgi:hypothetical protein